MSALLTGDLITQVQDRVFLPNPNNPIFTNSQIYSIANNEMRDKVFQFVQTKHEDYYIQALNIPFVGQATSIRIPYRAINSNIRNMEYYDNNNNVFHLPVMQMRDEDQFRSQNNNNRPAGFYVQGSYFQLLPSQAVYTTGSLEFKYTFAPNALCDQSLCTQITSINSGTGLIGVTAVPAGWAQGTTVDFISNQASYECEQFDKVITSISGSGILIGSTVFANVQVGDWICPAQSSCVVQLPDNCRMFLIERIAAKLFTTWGKIDHANVALQNCKDMESDLNANLANRSTEPVKVIRKYGLLRNNRNTFIGNPVVSN